ncbi:MAG TPA: hypothetical protein VGG39_33945 [Polyangiaceae bacterium]|jgi:hypothetical protein
MNNVSLVVMEKGSAWPGHVAAMQDVIAFSHDDGGLLQRTQEKLATLRSNRHSVRLAVLACNEDFGANALTRRARVARALLAAVSQASLGRLVLSASSVASPTLRAELLTLAGELTGELGRATATISLRFTEQARPAAGPHRPGSVAP